MKKKISVILLIITISAGIISCGSGKKSMNEKNVQSDPGFSIILGNGGGFTGLYEGYYFDSLSNVYKWKGRSFDFAGKNLIGKLNAKQNELINTSILKNKILTTEFKEHGNISTFIIIENNQTKHSISWDGIEPGQDVPVNIRNFYLTLSQIVDEIQKSRQE